MRRLLALALLAGCAVQAPVQDAAPPRVEVPVEQTVEGTGDLVAAADPAPDLRARRRLSIDQINASIRATTGFGWVDEDGDDRFEQLAETLGKADYVTTTQEDRTPSLVFQKFLTDAAHAVCEDLVQAETQRAQPERIFFVHAEVTDGIAEQLDAVEANLRHLLLRFHSRNLPAGADELDQWLWLHESAEFVGHSPRLAWTAVCVGLITHPDFYTY